MLEIGLTSKRLRYVPLPADLWDALKTFVLNSLKIKVAPYPTIVSLDTLRQDPHPCIEFLVIFDFLHHGIDDVKRHLL